VNSSAPYLISMTNSSLTLGNFTTNYNAGSNISFTNRFNVINPRSSRTFTVTFTTFFLTGGTQYGIETSTQSFKCDIGTLNASVSAGTNLINTNTTVTLNITLTNSIYSGSFIGVSFPQYLTAIVGGSCSTNNINVSCSVTANNYSNLSVSGTVNASVSPTIVITYNTITTAQ
jgi:hypothetical protein